MQLVVWVVGDDVYDLEVKPDATVAQIRDVLRSSHIFEGCDYDVRVHGHPVTEQKLLHTLFS
eukprot:5656699-Amphidinium_carterae.1